MATVTRYIDVDVVGGAGNGTSWADAYSSASAWEAAEQTDLVSDTDVHVVYARASSDSPDTTTFAIDGWTTNATYYITFEVGVADRHTGTGDTGYRLVGDPGGSDGAIYIAEAYTVMYGVAVKNTRLGETGANGIEYNAENITLKSCLAYECGNSGIAGGNDSDNGILNNCIALNNGLAAAGGNGYHFDGSVTCNFCDAINNETGTNRDGDGFKNASGADTTTCKNCYSGGNDGDDYDDDDGTVNLTTCHASDLTGNTQTALATGSGTYFTNVTAGSEDINITSISSGLFGVGTDLSGAGITTDYEEETRASTPCVGADEISALVPKIQLLRNMEVIH